MARERDKLQQASSAQSFGNKSRECLARGCTLIEQQSNVEKWATDTGHVVRLRALLCCCCCCSSSSSSSSRLRLGIENAASLRVTCLRLSTGSTFCIVNTEKFVCPCVRPLTSSVHHHHSKREWVKSQESVKTQEESTNQDRLDRGDCVSRAFVPCDHCCVC